jgi:hypothetical protein
VRKLSKQILEKQQRIEAFLTLSEISLEETRHQLSTLANDKGITLPSAIETWIREEDVADWEDVERSYGYTDPECIEGDDTEYDIED